MLSERFVEKLNQLLHSLGDHELIQGITGVDGGSINQTVCLSNQKNKYFLKFNHQQLPGMFEVESYGLELIRGTHSVRVPQVLAVGKADQDSPAFLLLEWLEPVTQSQKVNPQFLLGQQVAQMHLAQHNSDQGLFGLDRANYIGSTPQKNDWKNEWMFFFRDQRLGFQRDLAVKNGVMPIGRLRKLDFVIDHLDRFIGDRNTVKSSLLHGDLWGGNIQRNGDGYALIDPAVYYGDHEADLAFTELFGGFSQAFYKGYAEVFPIDPGYKTRKDLYNLYHLLNHLHLFGEQYGSQVDDILQNYSGS